MGKTKAMVRVVVIFRTKETERLGGFWCASNILFPETGADYTEVSIL